MCASPASGEDLAATLGEACERFGVPGAQLGLLTGGRSDVLCAGVRTIGEDARVERETPFHVGSIAKSLAATLVLDAAERGELDVDGRADEQGVAGWKDTLRALMSHTSGRPQAVADAGERIEDFVARVGALPRAHRAGLFSYSNAVWSVIELVLLHATGRDFEQLARERLLDRLGIDAHFGMPPDAAAAHAIARPGALADAVALREARAASAAGARWWATADDLLALAEMHLRGGAGIVGRGVVEEQRRTHVSIPDRSFADGWALGWATWQRGEYRAVGWNGSTLGHHAAVRIYPEQQAALALVTNSAGPLFGGAGGAALLDDILPVALQSLGVPPPQSPAGANAAAPRPAAELAGTYGFATVAARGYDAVVLTAPPLGVGTQTAFARAYANTFTAWPARPGGVPITFAEGLLYVGPLAVART
ncbi:MAG: hypothetical protein QOJ35_61 [Solirubrobacteraceae bacterium]|nr:hypothetical protein [Solirubrobacteraceae bacterium]